MADKKQEEQWRQADDGVRENLPPGVRLVRTLRGHTNDIGRIAWSPDGRTLASPSMDKTIRLWDTETGGCLRTLEGHGNAVYGVAFDPTGRILASASYDQTIMLWKPANGRIMGTFTGHNGAVLDVAFDPMGGALASASYDHMAKLWEPANGRLLRTLTGHKNSIFSIAFDPAGRILAGGGGDGTIKMWEPAGGKLLRTLTEHNESVYSLAFDPAGRTLASASADRTIKIWASSDGRLLRTFEVHTDFVNCVIFLAEGRLIASKGGDHAIRLSNAETGDCLAVIPEPTGTTWLPGLASHPRLPLLAATGSNPGAPDNELDRVIHIYELDLGVLLGQSTIPSIAYTSAKIVLVGDSGVGKTGLGWRLAHGEYKDHSSTHGQQFWLFKQLCRQRQDKTLCEAILWDLAGQDDYRIIHSLFLDDADLALVLFDPSKSDDALDGVEFWIKHLKSGTRHAAGTPVVLVAARSDRGKPRLTQEELEAFCRQRGINFYLSTSAKTADGIKELIGCMQGLIPWDDKPATVTTKTFKRIKDFVLDLKEDPRNRKVILTLEELRGHLAKTDRHWQFADDEMLTAIGHLANHGYVTRMKTSQGEFRLLLAPDVLNNLAASFVLEARGNRRGLGALEELPLLAGDYKFPELDKLNRVEKDMLIDSAVVLFLEHNICFRETDPLNHREYLVFPELINLRKPVVEDGSPTEDGVAYSVGGAVENVYASLVVLMGYTQTFTRTNQWRNQARYEVGRGHVCGFRQEEERAGELDFVLYYGVNTPLPVRTLFQGLFESFLGSRDLTALRFEPVACSNGHAINRAQVRERSAAGKDFVFCGECSEKVTLPKADQPIHLTKHQAEKVAADRLAADQRSRFEQALFRLKTFVTEQKIRLPECFISYAWGNPEQERWVEKSLAADLQKAGLAVVLDKWDNARIGSSVPRFIERIHGSDRIIVVGTPLYRKKYDNGDPMGGYIAAAEGDLIGKRMIGTEAKKGSVLPALLEGTEESAFPPLLHGRVYADFRRQESYFDVALDLLLSLYNIGSNDPVAVELRGSLKGSRE